MQLDFTKDKLTGRVIRAELQSETFADERILSMILDGVEHKRRFMVKGVGQFDLFPTRQRKANK